mgnify:CR=1 FL=1
MAETLGVALCRRLDVHALYAETIAERAPELRLTRPGDAAPEEMAFALCFEPPDDAFTFYPNLRLISSIAAGVDAILACPSRPPSVPVIRMRDHGQARRMAGFALWHVVHWHRRMDRLLVNQAAERWDRAASDMTPPEDVGVGILGFGLLGRALAQALTPLGYAVRSHARTTPEPEPGVSHFHGEEGLAPFLAGSDILVNLLPNTPATRNILSAALFEALPNGARVINLGRGAQLAEADLLSALASGRLAGASLDVFAEEPLPKDHPFWRHPQVVVTPHVAADVTRGIVPETLRAALAAIDSGARPQTEVDPAAGY